MVWSVLLAGGGLWSLVASGFVRWGWEFYLVQFATELLFFLSGNMRGAGLRSFVRKSGPWAGGSPCRRSGLTLVVCI